MGPNWKIKKTPRELHLELQRELKMRQDVYPGWVRKGKLTQAVADHRIQCMVDHITIIETFFPEVLEEFQGKLDL